MKIRGRVAIVALAALSLSTLAACSPGGESPDPSGGETTLTIGLANDTPVNFDVTAGVAMYAFPPLQAVYDSLFTWNQSTNDFDPMLATKWEYLNSDFTALQLTLRDDVDFSDGSHFDANAAKASLDTVLTNNASVFAVSLNSYGLAFSVVDDYTLELHATKAMQNAFFQSLAIMPIASTASLADPDSLTSKPVGTGPYTLDADSTFGVQMNYTRKADYWNAKAYPYTHLIIKQFADSTAAVNALRSGQVDATSIPLQASQELKSAGFELSTGFGVYQTLFFGDRDGKILPAIGDVRVRQAINMVFDREKINEALNFGLGRISSQPFTKGQAEYIEGADNYYTYDLAKAKQLMADAGYSDGFELTIPIASTIAAPVQPVVVQSLSDLGITVTYEQFPDMAALIAAGQTGKYPVILWPEYYVNTLPELLYAGGAWATAWGYHDATADELLTTINTGAKAESAAASQKMGKHLLEQAWVAPISVPPSVWAAKSGISVQVGGLTGSVNLWSINPSS